MPRSSMPRLTQSPEIQSGLSNDHLKFMPEPTSLSESLKSCTLGDPDHSSNLVMAS